MIMSKASDLIAAAVAANQSTGATLSQLAVDQAKCDAAIDTRDQHEANAAAQAQLDAAAVSDATAAVSTDLTAVATSQKTQADALAALSQLQPAANPPTNLKADPNAAAAPPV
jgi:hypothetical protein